jgi:hypothetical protein
VSQVHERREPSNMPDALKVAQEIVAKLFIVHSSITFRLPTLEEEIAALISAYAASERARADAAEREREVARRQLRELRVVFDTQTAEVESLRSELQRKQ